MSWTVMIKSYARVYSTDPSHPQQPTAGPPQESELPMTPANALGDHHSRSSSYPAAISFPQPKSQSTHSTSATPPRSFTSLPAFTTMHCSQTQITSPSLTKKRSTSMTPMTPSSRSLAGPFYADIETPSLPYGESHWSTWYTTTTPIPSSSTNLRANFSPHDHSHQMQFTTSTS